VQSQEDNANIYTTWQANTGCLYRAINGSMGRDLLNGYIYKTLDEVREKAEEWMLDNNNHRHHEALNNKPPVDLLLEINNEILLLNGLNSGQA